MGSDSHNVCCSADLSGGNRVLLDYYNIVFCSVGVAPGIRTCKRKEVGVMAYVRDALDDFLRHDAEQESKLSNLPTCAECGEPIQSEEYYEFNDECICPQCLRWNHRKWVSQYNA